MLNEKKFLAIFEDYQRSGLTIRDYCSNIGMNEAKFYYWKKKLNDQRCETNGFVPVVFEPEQLKHHQLSSRRILDNTEKAQPLYEISYPNGTRVKLSGHTNLETLRGLLQLNIAADV